MEEWDEVDIEVSITGLEASPQQLHAAFEMTRDHLSEVRDRHKMVLVEAGAIPESHISDCLLYTSPSPRDPKTSRMPSSA